MRTASIEIGGKAHLLCFSARVVRAVTERYGGVEHIDTALSANDPLKALDEAVWLVRRDSLNSFSPSMPIFGPISTAIVSPHIWDNFVICQSVLGGKTLPLDLLNGDIVQQFPKRHIQRLGIGQADGHSIPQKPLRR